MTATPGSAALLALADRIEKHSLGWIKQVEGEVSGCSELDACLLEEEEAAIVAVLRLAAKPDEDGVREALKEIIRMDDDAAAASGKNGNLNGVGLVDLFDCVGHPFGSGKHKQQPCRSNQLEAALADARRALSTTGHPEP